MNSPWLFLTILILMFVISVALSVSAFCGGFNYAYYRFLIKFKPLNDYIANTATEESLEALRELNKFLDSIQAEKENATFWDWLRHNFKGDEVK
jgi:hypothetical protein